MLRTIRKLFFISRPISWPNTAYPFAAGYLVTGGAIDLTFIIGTLYFFAPYNLMMYGVNDVYDYESDIKNPRKGGIEGMKEQKKFHPTILKSVAITNIPLLLILLLIQPGQAGLVLAGLVFFVLAYSLPILRFKERAVLDSFSSSIHFVGPLIYALVITDYLVAGWPFVLAFFLWGMASHALGAVQDIIPDKKAGISSVATLLGAAWTIRFVVIFYIAAAGIILSLYEYAVGIVALAYAVNALQFINLRNSRSRSANLAWRRFIWLNFMAGFIVTLVLIVRSI